MSTSARWSWTVNNPGEWRPHYDTVAMSFLVYQLERGAEGTTHLQGYVRFRHPKGLQAAKNAMVRTDIHMEIAQGNEGQNIDYCSKAESRVAGPWQFGTANREAGRRGSRSDLQAVAEAAKSGKSTRELAMEFPAQMIKYSAQIERYKEIVREDVPLERTMFVHVLWGSTGTGKTHRIRHAFPNPGEIYVVNGGRGRDPWGRYNGEPTVVFEEFDWSKWPIDEMKELLDKWRCNLDARYTDKTARYTKVFLTANTDPSSWYITAGQADKDAFIRRLTRITEVLGIEQEIELFPPPPAMPTPSPVAPASTPVLDSAGTGASIAPAPRVARTLSVNLQDYFDLTDDK